jgi:hypothetical protein
MATATRTTNKTAFLTGYLGKNPNANSTVVNQAWTAAGNTGTISPSLVSNLRSRLGLIGMVDTGSTIGGSKRAAAPGKTSAKTSTKAKARVRVKTWARAETGARAGGPQAARRSKPAFGRTAPTRRQGKSAFIKEVLVDDATATTATVNRAWKAAGMEGTISESLVSKVRSGLGLAGNLRKKSAAARWPAASAKKPRRSDRDRSLAEVEGEIDHLIFKLLAIGGVEKAEAALRSARRAVVRSQKA